MKIEVVKINKESRTYEMSNGVEYPFQFEYTQEEIEVLTPEIMNENMKDFLKSMLEK